MIDQEQADAYINGKIIIRSIDPRKGKNMNEITTTDAGNSAELFDLEKFEEILDDNGNPTGQYRPRETTQEGTALNNSAAVFVTAEDGDHEVTIH